MAAKPAATDGDFTGNNDGVPDRNKTVTDKLTKQRASSTEKPIVPGLLMSRDSRCSLERNQDLRHYISVRGSDEPPP
jgi:hypothetical protein